jgi:hypothetical protein
MPSFRLAIALSIPVLLLSACEGYEPAPYVGFPYDNIRTAGTGVEYVRANMAPSKGPVLQPAKPVPAPPPAAAPAQPAGPAPAPIQETKDILENIDSDAEKLFNENQRK